MGDVDAGGDHFAFLLQQGHRPGVGGLRAEGEAVHHVALWGSVAGALLERGAQKMESVLGWRTMLTGG